VKILEDKIEFLKSSETKYYIDKFKNTTFVVKYGGAALEDKNLMQYFLRDIAAIYKSGIKLILVHGGGKLLSQFMREVNLPVKFEDGMRVTTKETIPIAIKAFNTLNKQICNFLQSLNIPAMSLSGESSGLVNAEALFISDNNLEINNFVGKVKKINHDILGNLEKHIPIITSLGIGDDGNIYNINADLVASKIASSLRVEKIIFISDVNGIYLDAEEPATHISHITPDEVNKLIANEKLKGGMKLKIELSLDALKNGVNKVHFINGKLDHSLLKEIFTHHGIGTEIVF